jgi:preprotein translocase subunit SecE
LENLKNVKDQLPVIIGIFVAAVIFVILWRKGAFLRISNYFRETQEELKKCSWPSWDELKGSTAVVVVAIALLGGFTMVVDFVIAMVVRAFIAI